MQPIAIIAHNVRSTYNIGSILRSANCFGVSDIFLCGYSPYPIIKNDTRLPHIAQKTHKQIAKTALGAETLVNIFVHNTIEQAIMSARKNGYTCIAAVEQADNSTAIETYPFSEATALIVGNEVYGINTWTKQAADVILEITQYGDKESLNVASATAIALFAARQKYTPYGQT